MKRWVSGAMAFIITFSCAQGGYALASDVDEDDAVTAQLEVSADVAPTEDEEDDIVVTAEPLYVEDAPAEYEAVLGDDGCEAYEDWVTDAEDTASVGTGDTADGTGDAFVETDDTDDGTGEADADAPARRYAMINAGETTVCQESDGGAFAVLGAGCAVLVLEEADAEWTRIAFNSERGIMTGCVAVECLTMLDAGETDAYLDALMESAAVALYGDDPDAPLAQVACVFIDPSDADEAETPADATEETPSDSADEAPADATDEAPADEGEETPSGESDEAGDGAEDGQAEPEEVQPVTAAEVASAGDEADATGAADAADATDATDAADATDAGAEGASDEAAPQASGEVNAAEAAPAAGEAVAAEAMQVNLPAFVMGVKERFKGLAVVNASSAVTWSSSNKKVVSVNAKTGVVKAIKRGTAVITATAADGQTASAAVTVMNAPKKIKFSAKKLSMGAGGMTFPLTLTMTKGAAAAGITFTSSNPGVASVDAGGVVTSHGAGTAVITAKTYNKKKAACKVTVYAAPARVEMPGTYAVALGQASKLGVQAYAADGKKTEAGLTFRIADGSPNPECISIDNATGTVTGVSLGTAYVTATTYNGLSCGPCAVTVTPVPTGINLPAKVTLGNKETLSHLPYKVVTAAGEVDGEAGITWSSTNKKVVRVDPNTGELKALKKGKATIVAKTQNGLKAKCRVTVKKAPKKVSLTASATTIDMGATATFTVKLPKGSGGTYAFASSNPSVATIDQNGVATGLSAGKTTITVLTYNGKSASATLNVGGSNVEVPEIMKKLGLASYQNVYSSSLSNEQKLEHVIYNAQNQLDKPYVYGGGYDESNPSGFDCSGLVYWCFRKAEIKLENSAYKQGYDNKYTKIAEIGDLKRGDVVCFNTNGSDNDQSDHTGIYLGNGYFIHASSGSSKKKVIVQRLYDDSISNDYYKRAFSWGRRILE